MKGGLLGAVPGQSWRACYPYRANVCMRIVVYLSLVPTSTYPRSMDTRVSVIVTVWGLGLSLQGET